MVAITASEDPATGDDTSSSRIMGHFNEIVAKPTSDENMKAIFKRHLTKKAACGRSARISKPAVGRPHVAPSAATDACAAANPIRCLVVEDDKVSRVMMARLLKAAGISMLEAHDGMEGVKQATSAEVDIILMDCDMPVKVRCSAGPLVQAAAVGRAKPPYLQAGSFFNPPLVRIPCTPSGDIFIPRKPHHFAVSIFVLFLTVYSYCYYRAATPAGRDSKKSSRMPS